MDPAVLLLATALCEVQRHRRRATARGIAEDHGCGKSTSSVEPSRSVTPLGRYRLIACPPPRQNATRSELLHYAITQWSSTPEDAPTFPFHARQHPAAFPLLRVSESIRSNSARRSPHPSRRARFDRSARSRSSADNSESVRALDAYVT